MSFLNPLLLYFLPAIIIPLILNFFPGISSKKIPFPLYFLINKTKSGHGINLRSILKTIIRMLIIATLILIFAHPYIKAGTKEDIIIFDNSIYDNILDNNVPIFYKGKKLLMQMKSNKIFTFNDKGLYAVNNINNIKILKGKTDIQLPVNPSMNNNIVIISPFTQNIPINAEMYDIFPTKFNNAGIIFNSYSIIEHTVNIKLYSQYKDANVSITAMNGRQDINIFTGTIKKGKNVNLILNIPLKGKVKIVLHTLNYKDDFLNDNVISLYFPKKLIINLKYKNKFLKRYLDALSHNIPIEHSSNGFVISEGILNNAGIYFPSGISTRKGNLLINGAEDTVIPINYSLLKETNGIILSQTEKNIPMAILKHDRLFLNFNFENNKSNWKNPDFINLFSKLFDKFLTNYYCNNCRHMKLGPVAHYKPQTKNLSNKNILKHKDYQKSLLILFIILMIFEILI